MGSSCSAENCCCEAQRLHPPCTAAASCSGPCASRPAKRSWLCSQKQSLHGTQTPHVCELVQAEKECKELETQVNALYRVKYVPPT